MEYDLSPFRVITRLELPGTLYTLVWVEYTEEFNGNLGFLKPGDDTIYASNGVTDTHLTPAEWWAAAQASVDAAVAADPELINSWLDPWIGPYWNIPEWEAHEYRRLWRWRRRLVYTKFDLGEAPAAFDNEAWRPHLPSGYLTYMDTPTFDRFLGGADFVRFTVTYQRDFQIPDVQQTTDYPW